MPAPTTTVIAPESATRTNVLRRRQRVPVVLRLSPQQASDLPRWMPHLVAEVRRQLRQHGDTARDVTIDLSALPPTPACAPLLMLFTLVRRLLSADAGIVVTGVSPALRACLIAELPTGVTVVDRRGRRWS